GCGTSRSRRRRRCTPPWSRERPVACESDPASPKNTRRQGSPSRLSRSPPPPPRSTALHPTLTLGEGHSPITHRMEPGELARQAHSSRPGASGDEAARLSAREGTAGSKVPPPPRDGRGRGAWS